MSTGIFAVLDDIVALAKAAAVSLDDLATQSVKATANASGIVIDDTATTPQYVTGLHPSRELPIIGRIAWGSIINKGLIIVGIMGLSIALSYTGWPIENILTPILMAGGLYLAYEGYEKVHEMITHRGHAIEDKAVSMTPAQAKAAEGQRIKGAIRTDLILSAEIMTLTFSGVATASLGVQVGTLLITGLIMTIGVYGVVAILVKMDDIGLAMAKTQRLKAVFHPIGRGIVKGMPAIFRLLEGAGALAMLWVGGGMLIHGAHYFGFHAPNEIMEHAGEIVGRFAGGFGAWLAKAIVAGILGAILGGLTVAILHMLPQKKTETVD